jgi:phage protein D
MQENGVDMSRVSISRSYAVLVGLEAYVKTRRKFKHGVAHVKEAETKVMHPEEHQRMIEEQKDKSKSAEKERQLLAQTAEKEEAEKKEQSAKEREDAKEQKKSKWLSKSGQDVESAIPPAGTRDKLEKAAESAAT